MLLKIFLMILNARKFISIFLCYSHRYISMGSTQQPFQNMHLLTTLAKFSWECLVGDLQKICNQDPIIFDPKIVMGLISGHKA